MIDAALWFGGLAFGLILVTGLAPVLRRWRRPRVYTIDSAHLGLHFLTRRDR